MRYTSDDNPNSLAFLTRKFIDYMRSNGINRFTPVSELAAQLKVQKRRLYDIINVLEGVGVVEKSDEQEQIHCRVKEVPEPQEELLIPFQNQIKELEEEEHQLNQHLDMVRKEVESLFMDEKYSYVDLKDLMEILPILSAKEDNASHDSALDDEEASWISIHAKGETVISVGDDQKVPKLGVKTDSVIDSCLIHHNAMQPLEAFPTGTYIFSMTSSEGPNDLFGWRK